MMNDHLPGTVILAHLHGELDPAEAARVRDHCASCPECQTHLAALRSVQDILDRDALGEDEKPRSVWNGVRAGVPEKATPLFAAGTLAACLLGLLLGLRAGQDRAVDGSTQAAGSTSSLDYLWSGQDSASFLWDRTSSSGRNTP